MGYAYGLEQISRQRTYYDYTHGQWVNEQVYYVHDGHGSVRALTDATGAVTDTYDYDAFGNLIHSTGTTPNNYLFAGEQFDPDLGLYYNRARYLNTSTGRFWNMDTHEGDDEDPTTLHKYVYVGDEPTDRADPSGNDFDIGSALFATAVVAVVATIAVPSLNQYEQGGSAEPRVATTQSERGEDFLKYHEGINGQPNLTPYDHDGSSKGNCTIGWGSKIREGRCQPQDFSAYANFSVDAAEQLLTQDVLLKALMPIKRRVHVGLAQREMDALIDFTFNVGGANLGVSQLLQQLNAGNYKQAGAGFMGWLHPTTIRQRRVDEQNLWLKGDYTSNGHPIR